MFNQNASIHIRKKLADAKGLTFVELLIALSIALIVVAAAYYILLYQSGVFRASKSIAVEQERLDNAFNTVKFNLRFAGFDYGSGFYYLNEGPNVPFPVTVIQAGGLGNNNPYEVLISRNALVVPNSSCTLTAHNFPKNCSAEYDVTPQSCMTNFYRGQLLTGFSYVPCPKYKSSATGKTPTICIDQVGPTYVKISPTKGNSPCPDTANNVPPESIAVLSGASIIRQYVFYWGNSPYTAPPVIDTGGNVIYSNKSPFNVPGDLYECTAYLPANSSNLKNLYCLKDTVVELDDYVNYFNISPVATTGVTYYGNTYYYAYNLSISAESNVAITTSPSYSVYTLFTNSYNGGAPEQRQGVNIPGYNIVKTLSQSVYLRNVKNGK